MQAGSVFGIKSSGRRKAVICIVQGDEMNTIWFGEPLARGRTADVYGWDDGWVLKLFQPWMDRPTIEQEAQVTRLVRASGLPVPAVGEIVEVDGRVGVIYERIDGPTMANAVQSDVSLLEACAKRLAQLHVQIHSVQIDGELPALGAKLEWRIQHAPELTDEMKRNALAALAAMPDGTQLCHGDFHPENVLMTGNGGVLIDWLDASRGNALADVARTSIILLGETQREDYGREIRKVIGDFHAVYLDEYFRLRPQLREEYADWLPIVAASRLSEGIKQVEGWLVAIARI